MIEDNNFYDEMWNPITGSTGNWPTSYAAEYCNRFKGDLRLNISASDKILKLSDSLFILEKPFPASVEKHYVDCPAGTLPTFHKYRIDYLTTKFKTGRNILVCGMGELFDDKIPDVWIETVINTCKNNPQHNYIFLTTNIERLSCFVEYNKSLFTDNMWFGISINNDLFNNAKSFEFIKSWKAKSHLFIYFDSPRTWNTFYLQDLVESKAIDNISWIASNYSKYINQKYYYRLATVTEEYSIPLFIAKCEGQFPQRVPQEFSKYNISPKRKKLRMAKCGNCKRKLEKRQMHTVGSYIKRGEGYKVVGYLCEGCYEEFCKQFE